MFTNKKKHYHGRWIVKLIESALIFGVIFFTIDAIQHAFAPRIMEVTPVVVRSNQVEVVRIQPPAEPQVVLTDVDYFRMGYDHQVAMEYYEAIADYTRSVEMNPALSASILNRGVAYEQLNLDHEAMYDFNRFMNREEAEARTYPRLLRTISMNIPMAEGHVYQFRIYAQAGETLTVAASSVVQDMVDPLVVVVDANGTPVAGSDDILRQDGSLISMNSMIEDHPITQTGYYTVRVSHAGGGSEGELRISVATQ